MDSSTEMLEALQAVISWYGKRGGPNDELLPIERQEKLIQQAIRSVNNQLNNNQ